MAFLTEQQAKLFIGIHYWETHYIFYWYLLQSNALHQTSNKMKSGNGLLDRRLEAARHSGAMI